MPSFFFTALILASGAVSANANAPTTQERYALCTHQVSIQADAAYAQAQTWFKESGALPAQHCKALALYEKQQYKEAASELDAMLQRLNQTQPELWLRIKGQAALAHRYAGSLSGAEKHLTDAVNWATTQDNMEDQTAELLLQRGELHAAQKEHLLAIQDYDHAYALLPSTDILYARAKLSIAMGKPDSARDDLNSLLSMEPDNADAKKLLSQLNPS